jgi:hypothetical protein
MPENTTKKVDIKTKQAPSSVEDVFKLEYIQTLHPDEGKKNKRISLLKYNFIKENIIKILKQKQLTHNELMEALYTSIKDDFEGGVQWYGETVKLDLEARQIIERMKTKPEKYKLRTTNVDF